MAKKLIEEMKCGQLTNKTTEKERQKNFKKENTDVTNNQIAR